MDKIILELHETLEKGKSIIVEYNKRADSLAGREANVLRRELSIKSREAGIQDREAACQKVEDIVNLKKEAQALMDASNLRINAATEAERALNIATQAEHNKLAQTRLATQKEVNALEVQKRGLSEEVSKRVKDALNSMGIKQKE